MGEFDGFSKQNREQRLSFLKAQGLLDDEMLKALSTQTPDMVELAEHLSENVLGLFELPYSVAVNFVIDKNPLVIPMAVEETSIIASASKTAKWVSEQGYIQTSSSETIGQIYFSKITNLETFKQRLEETKKTLIADVNKTVASSMFNRGGGLKDLSVRVLQDDGCHTRVVVHAILATCDAMGANMVNQVCEYLKAPLEAITGEKVLLCILSNLSDTNLTQVKIVLNNIDMKLGEAIEEASYFSQIDPFRATTNNKGITNAIDAIAIATGNDWRAVEASLHAHAARSGQYQSLSKWQYANNTLTGYLDAPIPVGIVGGVTSLHPMAKISLGLLNVSSASELSRIMGAVGLVQNLGALNALVTKGIVEGHMMLHIDNILLSLNASNDEKIEVKDQLQGLLKNQQKISVTQAQEFLKAIRGQSR